MPFTFAHPAAVLPVHRVARAWLPLSALVIGSMTPDFAYFAPALLTRVWSHSLTGLLTFCVPVGTLVVVLHHFAFRRPLLSLLPREVAARLQPGLANRWPGTVRVVAAVAVGALTHLVWDAFTHENGRGVQVIPVLDTPLFTFAGIQVRGYRLLQHASTTLGFAVLLWQGGRWWRRAEPMPLADAFRGGRLLAWTTVVLCVAAGAALGARQELRPIAGGPELVRFAFVTTVGAMAGLAAGMCVHAFVWHARRVRVAR